MREHTAYCGIKCEKCPLYIATVQNDNDAKRALADRWGELYKRTFTLEQMECYGCKSDKRFFLSRKCDISVCNKAKAIMGCRECQDYPCQRLKEFYNWQEAHGTLIEHD